MAGMRLLVTGAEGMLGTDVSLAARREGHDVVGLARDGLDVTDRAAAIATIGELAPDAIVNCAAWTDVDRAEAEEDAALAVNGAGAGNVAAGAAAAGARLVHVSTDYVFDGSKRTPYVESDPVGPLGAYGRTKLAGEIAIAREPAASLIVRASWLFGVGGPNFVATMLRLGAERDEVTVVTDQLGCPTFTGHLGPALVALAAGTQTGLAHVAATGACSWHAFAVEIFRQAGMSTTVLEGTTEALGRPAPRPACSVLGSERDDLPTLPDWRDGLAAYLEDAAAEAMEQVA